jgi:hypothetical protein
LKKGWLFDVIIDDNCTKYKYNTATYHILCLFFLENVFQIIQFNNNLDVSRDIFNRVSWLVLDNIQEGYSNVFMIVIKNYM